MPIHRFIFEAVVLIAALALAPVEAAGAAALPAPVAAALREAAVPVADAAVVVHEVGAAQPLLAYNAGKPMNPASTMKLVTTLAALELLGPTFAWKTEAYTAGTQQGDVLEGDLVLRGAGDPKLTVENFWLMLRAMRARGLREIRGDLVLDRSYFEAVSQDEARFDNEPLRPYNVAPDALLLNFKAFRFTFVPDPERGSARVAVEPRSTLLEVSNAVRLAEGPCNDWRAKLKADFNGNGGDGARELFRALSGFVRRENLERGAAVAPRLCPRRVPPALGGAGRHAARRRAGRRGAGRGETAPYQRIAGPRRSRARHEQVQQQRHGAPAFSHAFRGGHETTGARRPLGPGRAELARPERSRIPGTGDGRTARGCRAPSGSARRSMGRLLFAAYASPVMPEFIASMPLVAYDGTMKRRLKHDSVAGQAHIKTGSLSDVRALAGYVLDARGRRFAVVFFVNHPNAAATQSAQDALLNWVYAGPGR